MSSKISRFFTDFLFPERSNHNRSDSLTPLKGMLSVHELLLRLAAQLESHAHQAPYPQDAARLRLMASQKHDSALKVKSFIESLGGKTTSFTSDPKSGRNHWQRLSVDLKDQTALDSLLMEMEIRTVEDTRLKPILEDLKRVQTSHRRTLGDLLAVADPQAYQT
jgi:hypothetical protein